MQLRICHAEVIDRVSVVTKLKVEIHQNIVLNVVDVTLTADDNQ